MKTNLIYSILFALLFFVSCNKEEPETPLETETKTLVSSVDLSALPQIETTNAVFYNTDGQPEDVLTTLKKQGVNTIRLRLWYNPENIHSSFAEVKTFSGKIKSKGFKVWLTVHYSDTWADPGNQKTPDAWQGKTYDAVKDSVYSYTAKIVAEINPDYIQIGNEINAGILFPYGKISENEPQFRELISTGIQAVRDNSNKTKVIIHFAGINGSNWFFNKIKDLDFEIIGLSYYPNWHGKNLGTFESTLSGLSQTYNKDIVIAETAYPFTLNWNDWTNNIVGLDEHLILPDYPATPQGQKDFIAKLKEIVLANKTGIGFCYWGGELIAFNGQEATDGSPWENQALYDFDNKALPVMEEFNFE